MGRRGVRMEPPEQTVGFAESEVKGQERPYSPEVRR